MKTKKKYADSIAPFAVAAGMLLGCGYAVRAKTAQPVINRRHRSCSRVACAGGRSSKRPGEQSSPSRS